MYRKNTVVTNRTGLHARPASDFIQVAKKFSSKITIMNLEAPEDGPVNAKSIVMLLSLGLSMGTHVEIAAEGEDEEQAVKSLIDFIDSGCGE